MAIMDPNQPLGFDPMALYNAGAKAIQSGAIDPKDAQKTFDQVKAHAPNMSQMPDASSQNLMSMAPTPNAQPGLMAMGTDPNNAPTSSPRPPAPTMTMPRPTGLAPVVKNSKISTQNNDTTTKAQQNTYLSPDDISKQQAAVAALPEVQDQNANIDNLKNALAGYKAIPQTSMPWLKALTALTDSQTGSHLMAGMPDIPSAADRNAMILKYQSEIAKAQNDSTKAQTDLIGKMKSGFNDQGTNNRGVTVVNNSVATPDARAQNQADSLTFRVGSQYNKDGILKAIDQNTNSLDRAVSILQNPNAPVTNSSLMAAYNDYVNSLAASGQATEGKVSREVPHSLAQAFNDAQSYITPGMDLRKDAQGQVLIKNLMAQIAKVKDDYASQGAQRAQELTTNAQFLSNGNAQATAQARLQGYQNKQTAQSHPQDSAAVAWAKANPHDPRSAKILQVNGQ